MCEIMRPTNHRQPDRKIPGPQQRIMVPTTWGPARRCVTCHCGPRPSVFFPCLALSVPPPPRRPLDGEESGEGVGPGQKGAGASQPSRRG